MNKKTYRVQDTMLQSQVSQMPCVISGAPGPNDPHHLSSKGAMGGDVEWNIVPLKHELHQEFHKIGFVTFANKHPKFKEWLIEKGWTFDDFRKKWFHP